jgi:hypothetical protein
MAPKKSGFIGTFRGYVLTFSAMAVAAPATAADCPRLAGKPVPREQFQLYLLMGQSNMAGRGKMTAEDRRPVEGIYKLNADDKWEPAAHPLHFDKPQIAGVGLGLDFSRELRRRRPDVVIGLIPCAFGGTRLDEWQPGGKLYNQALARAKEGARCGVVKGILWHQGEGDSTADLAATYAQRLQAMIGQLRTDLRAPNLPVVVGELGHFRQKVPSDAINAQLRVFTKLTPRTACATAENLTDSGDQTHFDADSLKEFGRRYAAQMIALESAGAERDDR